MPDPLRGQRVAANWEAVVGTTPQDAINNDYWLLNQLSKGDGFLGLSGGDFITQPLEYALNTTVASYTDTDPILTTRVDVFDRCEYQWREYAGTYVISELEEDRNAGVGQVFDLRKAKLTNLQNSMRATLNTDLHGDGTGNSGKATDGLANLVASNPLIGSPGGINRANFPFWRNQQVLGTKTNNPYDNLRAAMRSCYNLCSNGIADDHPTFAITTRTIFEAYEGLLIANERFVDKSNGDGAFKNEVLKFKGAMISYDVAAVAGELRFLNQKYLKLAYKTGSWMKMRPAIQPANQTIDIVLVRTMCDLIAINPRRLGVVTVIT